MGTSATTVRIEGLRVERGGRVALDSVEWTARRGRVVGLLGPSGSGKTTLLRCVVGVQRIAAGRVQVLGQPAGSPGLRRRVGYMTQSAAVYDDLTVTENLRYFARVLDVGNARVDELLEVVELTGVRDRLVGTLSGGQRSRVSLSTAMLARPEVLVLDEPTVGLDPVLRRDLWKRFSSLAEDGTTLLASTHVMDEADRCDDLALLREGRVIADGTPASILEHAEAPTLEQAFLRMAQAGAQ